MPSSRAAADYELRRYVENDLDVRQLSLRLAAKKSLTDRSSAERTRSLQNLQEAALRLRNSGKVVAAVSKKIAAYDPRSTETDPLVLIAETIQSELEHAAGTTASITPPARTALGSELKRRLALDVGNSDRRRLDEALGRVAPADAKFIRDLYTLGTKEIQRQIPSGRRRDRARQQAIAALLRELPELALLQRTNSPDK